MPKKVAAAYSCWEPGREEVRGEKLPCLLPTPLSDRDVGWGEGGEGGIQDHS